jgi:RNA polymerase sigma factor (sigma-70 family)
VLEARWFALVDRLAVSECRRRGSRPDESDEFRSFIRLRFAERGDAIFAAHDGRSSLETYLVVVVARAFQDWRRTLWGYWRPCAEALRLGTVAVELDRRLSLKGESFETAAAAILSTFGPRVTREQLEEIRRHLPQRTRPIEVSTDALDGTPATNQAPDESLNTRERAEITKRLTPLMRTALEGLSETDRLVLILVFREGQSVRAASRTVGLEHKNVGRRLERAFAHLRAAMEAGGVDRHAALLLLEGEGDGETWLPPALESGWDSAPPRPSKEEAEP